MNMYEHQKHKVGEISYEGQSQVKLNHTLFTHTHTIYLSQSCGFQLHQNTPGGLFIIHIPGSPHYISKSVGLGMGSENLYFQQISRWY